MAMSALERKRKQLERQRAEARSKPEATRRFAKEPFFAYFNESRDAEEFHQDLDACGIDTPLFEDDRGPSSNSGSTAFHEEHDAVRHLGSTGRAEHMVECLLRAARHLASALNDYKVDEISRRITALEASDLSDPEIRKAALEEIVVLDKIRDRLKQQVRWTVPVWEVK